MLEFEKPEVTTVVRWILRVILIVVLAWLVRRRPEEEEDDEEDDQDQGQTEADARRQAASRRQQNSANARTMARFPPKRDPYATPQPRQRRPVPSGGGGGGSEGASMVDFDSIIDKMSKPKDMWEVRKDGVAPQIIKRQSSQDDVGGMGRQGASGRAPPPWKDPNRSECATAASGRPILKVNARTHVEDKNKENTLHGHERPIVFITFNRDCNLLFSCGKDKIVSVWSFPEGEQLGTYKGHNGAVWACSVTADSRFLVTSGADQFVIVWEARVSAEISRKELPGVVRFVEWAGGAGTNGESKSEEVNERFVTCRNKFGSNPAALQIWQFDGSAITEMLTINKLPSSATQVRWGLADEHVVSSHESGELIFWRADTGEETRRLQAHSVGVSKFDFSSDYNLVATSSKDMVVKLWDIAETEMKLVYQTTTDRPLNAVALGPITREDAVGVPAERSTKVCVIAAGGQDVRDVAKTGGDSEQFGTLLFRLGAAEEFPSELQSAGVTKGHFGPVHTLAFTRDGSAVASGSEDGCVRIFQFDAQTPAAPIKEAPEPTPPASAAAAE